MTRPPHARSEPRPGRRCASSTVALLILILVAGGLPGADVRSRTLAAERIVLEAKGSEAEVVAVRPGLAFPAAPDAGRGLRMAGLVTAPAATRVGRGLPWPRAPDRTRSL